MVDDVYSTEHSEDEHSLRYLHCVIRNTLGIVNRITSLMRRKRYFIEDMTIAFDEKDLAHIIFSIDGRMFDIQQVMRQLRKIHDVLEVYDTTDDHEKLYNTVYVRCDDPKVLETLSQKPARVLQERENYIGTFIMSLEETSTFVAELKKKGLRYMKRLVNLV